ncbi:MAG: hypothetical protein HQK55_01075 [Deltaproteobacteria bacterium]|nr:hypothetical protein [Deltaproteobacteria bacterium]
MKNEIRWFEQTTGLDSGLAETDLAIQAFNLEIYGRTKQFLDRVAKFYNAVRSEARKKKLAEEETLRKKLGRSGFDALKREHYNKDIAALALNMKSLEAVRLSGDRLVQMIAPICQTPESSWGKAHFMAARKRFGPWLISTFTFNMIVLWCMAAMFYVILYFALLPRIASSGGAWIKKLRHW